MMTRAAVTDLCATPRASAPGAISPAFRDALEAALGTPFTEGNAIDAYRNGVEIFPPMLDAISRARSFVDFETFVYWSGDIARAFAQALADAARRGVRVRVLLDAIGAWAMPQQLEESMRAAGVDVRRFRPFAWRSFTRFDQRTHRKILVCDGSVAFIGGVGIAEEWEGDARDPREWRETHFRVRGPAVAGIWAGFLGNWMEVDDACVPLAHDGESRLLDELHAAPGNVAIQIVRATSSAAWSDIATALRVLVARARRRIRITTPYFVPDAALANLLEAAAQRGVQVDIILPGPHTDHRICQLAGEAVYADLLSRGVRLWVYQPTMIHTKALTVDGHVAMLGSANFNHRSMKKDDELSAIVIDAPLVETLDTHFEQDLDDCVPLDPADWRRRGLLRRALERWARVFQAQL